MKAEGLCWKCGKKEATHTKYGYPICDDCDNKDFDPEEMEMVVIESLKEGMLKPLD